MEKYHEKLRYTGVHDKCTGFEKVCQRFITEYQPLYFVGGISHYCLNRAYTDTDINYNQLF